MTLKHPESARSGKHPLPEERHGEASLGAGQGSADAALEQAVATLLGESREFDASEVDVTVSEGVLVLAGTVLTTAERHRLIDAAEKVPGVSSIDDRLAVKYAGLEESPL